MRLLKTIKDTFYSTLPLAVVIIICLIISPLNGTDNYFAILIGYASVIIGQALFLVGLEKSIIPIGHLVGNSFSKYGNIIFVLCFGFLFGLLATVAEPALSVLAMQINDVLPIINTTIFIWITGTGIGIGVALALVRMIKNINVKLVFGVLYVLVFILVIFSPPEFISIAFDGSGATTGDVSVPFILALGIGISSSFSKNKTQDDSLGIVGIASIGPIIVVLLYGIIVKATNGGVLPPENPYLMATGSDYFNILLGNLLDVALAVLPILAISIPFLIFLLKLPKRVIIKLMLGIIPVYVGLLVFLTGIDYGFQYIGQYIGKIFFDENMPHWFPYILLIIGFVLGIAITVSEPAVTVLGIQIEELTNGHIKQLAIRITLAISIGFASLLSILKILTGIDILWFLVPMYFTSVLLMKFTPKLFVGLAFDSGGVSGGALTSAFLTPLTLSIAQQVALQKGLEMSILKNGFGIISFTSVAPIIAIEILGIVYNLKSKYALKLDSQENFEDFKEINKKQRRRIFNVGRSRKNGK